MASELAQAARPRLARAPLWAGRRSPARSPGVLLAAWVVGCLLLAFILVPLIVLATSQPIAALIHVGAKPAVQQAILLSVEAALLATLFAALIGVPLAYGLAHMNFRGKGIVAAIIDLPLAVPHTVAGIALLLVLGRRGIIGGPAEAWLGLQFWGSTAGIVAAMLFVSVPYTVSAARIGFEAIDPELEKVARTLGMGAWAVLARVSVPLAWRNIASGLTLSCARAISEFGAVLILAYYPMTAPIKIYELFLRSGLGESAGMATLLLVVSLALLIGFRTLARGPARLAPHRR